MRANLTGIFPPTLFDSDGGLLADCFKENFDRCDAEQGCG